MFGITEAVARSYGYSGDMRSMPISIAKDIYSKKYWSKLNLDEIAVMSDELAAKLFDIGVNMGQARAGLFYRRHSMRSISKLNYIQTL